MWLNLLGAFLSGVGAVVGSAWVVRSVVRHEQKACDARLEAYKEGLAHGEHEDR